MPRTPYAATSSHIWETLGYAPSNLPGQWQRLFAERTEEENQKIQEEFGAMLFDAIGSVLTANGFKLTGKSHKGLNAIPLEGAHHRYRHLDVVPRPSRNGLLNDERRRLVACEVLTVGLIYNRAEDATAMYEAVPPLFHDGRHEWVAIPPHTINRDRRARVEFATDLRPFVATEEGMLARLKESLGAVLTEIWQVENELAARQDSGKGTGGTTR